MHFHQNEGGVAPGRRNSDLGSLNKSAVVLLCAAWESYIEAVVLECVQFDISKRKMRQMICERASVRSLESVLGMIKMSGYGWIACGEGWKKLALDVAAEKIGALNTPKEAQIVSHFSGYF